MASIQYYLINQIKVLVLQHKKELSLISTSRFNLILNKSTCL